MHYFKLPARSRLELRSIVLLCSEYWSFCKHSQLSAQFLLACLFLFSTCFGRLCAHHQEKQLCLCDN